MSPQSGTHVTADYAIGSQLGPFEIIAPEPCSDAHLGRRIRCKCRQCGAVDVRVAARVRTAQRNGRPVVCKSCGSHGAVRRAS